MNHNQDQKFMSLALNLAKKNIGLTAPNPVVGCVIVKNGQIISTGVTSFQGRPHAEVVAINKIINKDDLIGSTLYSTLEPCSHYGQTPPCVNLIIENKISRVVIGAIDPDSRVNGSGIEKLKAAKIEVVQGIMEKECAIQNRAFFSSKIRNRPFLTLKIATSLDGKIATKSGESKWISNEKSLKFVHILRAENEGILVGGNTVRVDNPRLDCRISGLENYSPRRFVLSKSLDFSFEENVFNSSYFNEKKLDANSHLSSAILLTDQKNSSSSKLQIWLAKDSNNQVIFFEKSDQKNEQNLDFNEILQKISSLGINSLLVEGGNNISTQLLRQNLVDEFIWSRSQKIIGNDGIAAIGNLDINSISKTLQNFSDCKRQDLDGDQVEIFSK